MITRNFARRTLVLVSTSVLLFGAGLVLAAPANAEVETTVTFDYTGAQESWQVPTEITSLSVEVAGAQGAGGSGIAGAEGGKIEVDLGIGFAGEELSVLVGGESLGSLPPVAGSNRSGGGGSFVALDQDFVVVAGGGGGSGSWEEISDLPDGSEITDRGVLSGGIGGNSITPAGHAQHQEDPRAAGKGALGQVPGEPGIGYGGPSYQGVAGTVASITGDGQIVPGRGGGAGHLSGAGGGGLAGGGGGSNGIITTVIDLDQWLLEIHDEYGAGGGGSGYLAPDLSAISSGTNAGHGFVAFTFTTPTPDAAPEFDATPTPILTVAGETITPVVFSAMGNPTPTLSLTGDLPDGLIFDPTGGQISGTPTTAGNFDYTIRASNGIEPDAVVTGSITVEAAETAELSITPEEASVNEGGTLNFEVDGIDAFGNESDVSDVTLSSDVSTDEVNGLAVTFPTASPHTITATTTSGVTASVTIDVIPAAITPAPETEAPESINAVSGELSATGGELSAMILALAVMLMVAGSLLVWTRRKAVRGLVNREP